MDHRERFIGILGQSGLESVLRAALDQPALVRAANTCRLSYPGKRALSVPTATLATDLAKKSAEDPVSALALARILDKACSAELKEVAASGEADLERLGSDPPGDRRAAARLLYALSADPRDTARAAAARLAERLGTAEEGGAAPQPDGQAGAIERLRARVARLEEEREEVERAALEARQEARDLSEQLLAARKGAHALEGRQKRLAEENALERERNIHLSGRIEELERSARGAEAVASMSGEVSRALRETHKLLHEIRESAASRPGGVWDSARAYTEALASTVRALQNEIVDLRREHEADRRRDRDALADLTREIHSMRSEAASARAATPERPARHRGEPPRVGLFVDVQNMYYAARQLNARLDFGALIEAVSRERRLIRAIAYVIQNRDIDQSGFLAMLQQRNYEVRRKDLRVRGDGSSKGDWDMGIALDILRLAPGLDVVVLVSGDGDFVELVQQVKTMGPRVEIYSFAGSTSKELIEACDRHVPIDEGLLIRLSSTG